jgi:capsular polysaccharide transport system permease protein
MRLLKWFLRSIFFLIFISAVVYTLFVESERYESKGVVLVKDLGKKQSMDLGSVLLGQSSTVMQDSKVLELYIRSKEMFDFLDKEFNLSRYYVDANQLDPLQRLYKDSKIPYFRASKKNILKKYNKDINVVYDDPSGTLTISFIHTQPELAQKILEQIIKKSEETINSFSRENSKIALDFIRKQIEEKKILFRDSIRKLITYQNKHHTIDPSLDVKRKVTILSKLEMELIKNEVMYKSKLRNINPNSREMKILKNSIEKLKNYIKRLKQELAGRGKGKELNINVFEFELLKNNMEFNREIYRQTLINMEKIKVEVAQQTKHLTVIVNPDISDDYKYPNKFWDILTYSILVLFFYSILNGIILIIRNHQD